MASDIIIAATFERPVIRPKHGGASMNKIIHSKQCIRCGKVFNSKRLTLEGSVSPERETIGTWHRTRSRVYDDDLPDTFLIKTDARSPYPITGCQIRDVNFLMISENKAFYYLNLGEAEGDPRIVFEIETQPVPGDES